MNTPIDFRDEFERRPPSIRDQAAEWLLRWHGGDMSVADRYEYMQWLKTSPVHVAETLRVCRVYSYLDGYKPFPFESSAEDSAYKEAVASRDAPPQQAKHRNRISDHLGVRLRRGITLAAIISIGFGALTMAWAALQETEQESRQGVPAASVGAPEGVRVTGSVTPTCVSGDAHTASSDECRKMRILHWQGLCAFTTVLLMTSIILFRRRKLIHEDIGSLFSTFMAASSVPVAIHLCSFALPMAQGTGAIVFPDLYALYVSAAGFVFLLSSGVTICHHFAAQWQRREVTASRVQTSEAKAPGRASEAPHSDEERKAGSGRA
jgi:hypothetical protein